MIHLVLHLCLIATPADCIDKVIPFDGGLFACVRYGQFQAAEWVASHDKYRLKRWSCGPPRLGI